MKQFIITQNEEGRRLDKYVMNILKEAPASFIYKMLRKKNIVLNGKKASGSEILAADDEVKVFLSDETFDKFSRSAGDFIPCSDLMPDIVYEDEDVLIVNKPSGMLTQKSSASDISLNEICLSYVRGKNIERCDDVAAFTPSVCNRLDRNTSGLVTFAKTYRAAKTLSKAFRDRSIHKYYKCVVKGILDHDLNLKGSLTKDDKTNKVTIEDDGDGSFIDTRVHPLYSNKELTVAEVLLVTGKTHQIRAHLAHAGYPIVGDPKYGNRSFNEKYYRSNGINSQMLMCQRLEFPDGFELPALSGRCIVIDNDDLDKVM